MTDLTALTRRLERAQAMFNERLDAAAGGGVIHFMRASSKDKTIKRLRSVVQARPGMVKVKVLPAPTLLSAQIFPP